MSNAIKLVLAVAVPLAVGGLSGLRRPVATLWSFWRITPAAGWLLVPYLAWVSFAAVLNGSIWMLNR